MAFVQAVLKVFLFLHPAHMVVWVVLFIVKVLQPARTFSSGVPLPKTINWGWIQFFRLSSIFPPLRSWHPFHKDAFCHI
jgi:hypothetical protein